MARRVCSHRIVTVSTGIIAAVLLLSGCGSSQIKATDTLDPQLLAAMERWDRCVSRRATGQQTSRGFGTGCSAYRRDVADQFPRHLYARVNGQLKARERARFVRARYSRFSGVRMTNTLSELNAN